MKPDGVFAGGPALQEMLRERSTAEMKELWTVIQSNMKK